MAQNVDFRWNRSPAEIANRVGLNANTLRFMATDWHRLYDPFVPFRTGTLAHTVRYGVKDTRTATITHIVPYARRMYNGRGLRFSKDAHPLACAKWDQAAQAAGKKAVLVRDVQAYMRRRGR